VGTNNPSPKSVGLKYSVKWRLGYYLCCPCLVWQITRTTDSDAKLFWLVGVEAKLLSPIQLCGEKGDYEMACVSVHLGNY